MYTLRYCCIAYPVFTAQIVFLLLLATLCCVPLFCSDWGTCGHRASLLPVKAIEWQDNLLHAFQNSAKEEPSLGKSRCCWKLLASSASKRLLDAHPFVRHSDMPSGCARFLLHARCPLQTTCKENKQSGSRVWQNTMQSYFVYWTSAMACAMRFGVVGPKFSGGGAQDAIDVELFH